MFNGKPLITMDRRNVVFSLVQDRSKIQTFTPTIFKMSAQQQQQQQHPTAEKSVQTQDLSNATTVLLTNNPVTHFHAENAATEVANTLVSMATGHQRMATNGKAPTIVSVSTPNSLPILSLADYTTPRGVPTAMALASQANISPVKHEKINNDGDDDDTSMSTDEYTSNSADLNSSSQKRNKCIRNKSSRSSSTSKSNNQQSNEAVQYGPLFVKPRKSVAPTLANGRKSKDEPLPPDEDHKRKMRRDRNKQAAAKCRRKRNELREKLEKAEKILIDEQNNLERDVQLLAQKKSELESLLQRQNAAKKIRLPIATTVANAANISKTDGKTVSTSSLLDPNNSGRRVTINITNAQDLFAVAPLARGASLTTTDGSSTSSSSTVPMITIHIIPEMAQALFGSATVDKTKLAELLQQASMNATAPTISSMTMPISESMISNTDSTANSTS